MTRRASRRLGRAKNSVKTRRGAFTAVIERCAKTGLYVGYVPGFIGAHTQGATLEELRTGLREVVAMLFEDGETELEAEFVGTLDVTVV